MILTACNVNQPETQWHVSHEKKQKISAKQKKTSLTILTDISYQLYEVGTLAVDEWAVIFGTARREQGGVTAAQSPPRCTNGQCTNHHIAV